ncbi:hypothetical protein VP01_13859g1, partial [Puccinia sorghi]
LGVTVSRKSFSCWSKLYHETQWVVCDPEEYIVQGQNSLLSAKDCKFMFELACTVWYC